ncbi:hypothetical protein [Luteimonas saliphila]|uniref:hypothetical protein n=1 Tax=Luteimonas saliphila TaxID=2804919 RepID=UPI00192E232B|nr:hypothetical protein [Luteimonas saliphila]
MTTFYVGQRVKKVRGEANIGLTGVVVSAWVEHPIDPLATLRVKLDQAGLGTHGDYAAGEVAATHPDDWEPILDQKHEACDEDFKRSMDELLEREGVSA